MYEKQDIRRWVRDTIKLFMDGEKEESTGPDMKICYEENFSNSMHSKIHIKEKVDGKWVIRATFMPSKYFNGQWDMITIPWICDLVNDISDVVMSIIKK